MWGGRVWAAARNHIIENHKIIILNKFSKRACRYTSQKKPIRCSILFLLVTLIPKSTVVGRTRFEVCRYRSAIEYKPTGPPRDETSRATTYAQFALSPILLIGNIAAANLIINCSDIIVAYTIWIRWIIDSMAIQLKNGRIIPCYVIIWSV